MAFEFDNSLGRSIQHNRSATRVRRQLLGLALLGAFISGCSYGPPRVHGVSLDADGACDRLLADLDADQSGTLDQSELRGQPGLASLLEQYDSDGDGQITRAELTANFERIFDPKFGLVTVVGQVKRNGRPLGGAMVRLVPVSFLDDAIPAAEGTTSSNGEVTLSLDPNDLPPDSPQVGGLMRPGMYLVEVTHPSLQIPKKYNTETTLAREVSRATVAGQMNLEMKF